MGTISEKLTYLEETKDLIKAAIVEKGVEVSDTDSFRSYAEKIASIESGGGSVILPSKVRFDGSTDNDISTIINANTDTSNLTTMYYMFKDCSNLSSLDVSNFNTSNVTDMGYAFAGLNVGALDVSNFDTSKVISFRSMFMGTPYITKLDLNSFDLSHTTESEYSSGIYQMFYGCSSLKEIKCENTIMPPKVYMLNGFFFNCQMLESFDFIERLDWNYITNIQELFVNCYKLTSVDWSAKPFNTSAQYISAMNTFKNCLNLTSIKLPTNVKFRCEGMFYGCNNLLEIDLSGINLYLGGGTSYGGMFEGCNLLKKVENVDFTEYNNNNNLYYFFKNCYELEKLVMDWKGVYSSNYFLSNFYTNSNTVDRLRYIHLKNIGTQQANTSYKFNSVLYCNFYSWGDESDTATYPLSVGARQSLVDTLVNDSFDRSTAGYATCTVQLHPEVIARLTEDEIAQATAKGYTLAS